MATLITAEDMLDICAKEFRRLAKEAETKLAGSLTLVEREQTTNQAARFSVLAQHCEAFSCDKSQDVVATG